MILMVIKRFVGGGGGRLDGEDGGIDVVNVVGQCGNDLRMMKRFVRRKNVDVGLTRTSVGTTSRSRKNSERSRAISAKEF